jgi:hypothetical protein
VAAYADLHDGRPREVHVNNNQKNGLLAVDDKVYPELPLSPALGWLRDCVGQVVAGATYLVAGQRSVSSVARTSLGRGQGIGEIQASVSVPFLGRPSWKSAIPSSRPLCLTIIDNAFCRSRRREMSEFLPDPI